MTANHDFKRRVRARQARTGERYTVAREHVLRARIATLGASPLRRAALEGRNDRARTVMICDDVPRPIDELLHALERGDRGPALGGRLLTFDSEFDGQPRTVIAQFFPRAREPGLALSLFHRHAPANGTEAWTVMLPLVLEG